MPMALLRVRALCCCWQTMLDLHIHEGLKGLAPHIALQDLVPPSGIRVSRVACSKHNAFPYLSSC